MIQKLVFILLVFISFNIHGQDASDKHLKIVGKGQLSATPDLGVLHVEIREIAMSSGEAIEALASAENAVLGVLRSLKYSGDEVKTTSYNIGPNTIWKRGERYDSGFLAKQSLMVEFQNDRKEIGRIINAFSESKTDAGVHFSFKLSDKSREALKEQVIIKAIEDAKSKAGIIAKANDLKLGEVKAIQYGAISTGNTGYELMAVADEESISSFQGFNVQDITLNERVLIIYELRD